MTGNILFSRKISRRCALGWCSRNLLDLILHSSPLVCCRNTNRLGSITEPAGHIPVPIPTQSYILKRSLTFSLCGSEEPFAVCCRFDFSFEVLS